MVPKLHARGTSFKGAAKYLFHDKDRAETSERVDWVETRNLWTEKPQDAWFEMFDTWRERDRLKAASGLSRAGRDNKNPVLHLSLSWHPDEKPTPDQMRDAARSALEALALSEHQALIVAHNDEPQPHVHVLVNTVHPHSGKTAALKYSKETLSRWAEAFERDQGTIRCEQRVENNAERDRLKEERAQAPDKPYEPVKDRTPNRREWFDKQQVIGRMKAMHAELNTDQKTERDALWRQHQVARAKLETDTRTKTDAVYQRVKESYKPAWRMLYREQKAEKRYLAHQATHPFERACYVFRNADRLAMNGGRLSFKEKALLILSPSRLQRHVEKVHERERTVLSQKQRADSKQITDRVWANHRASFHQLVEHQNTERDAMQAHHHVEHQEVTFQKAKQDLMERPPERDKSPTANAFDKAAQPEPTQPVKETEVERIRRQMKEWYARGGGRDDPGREM